MTTELTVEDIAELRKQGDFREFLRMHIATNRPAAPPAPPTAAVRRDSSHRPGAWPAGTRPPGRGDLGTPEQWDQAVHAYRRWVAVGSPAGDFTCDCGCTPRGAW